MLDPLFDKIFAVIVFFSFFLKLNLPFYYIFFFFSRDIFTAFAAIVAFALKLDKIEIKARLFGKIVTILQFITLFFVMAEMLYLIKIGIYITFIMSIVAIIDYLKYAKRNGVFRQLPAKDENSGLD